MSFWPWISGPWPRTENDDGLRLQRLNQQIALVMTTIQTLDEDRVWPQSCLSLAEDAAAAIASAD